MESVSFVRGREKERRTEKENRKIFIYYFENENFFGLNLNESRLGHKLRKRETKCVCVCAVSTTPTVSGILSGGYWVLGYLLSIALPSGENVMLFPAVCFQYAAHTLSFSFLYSSNKSLSIEGGKG